MEHEKILADGQNPMEVLRQRRDGVFQEEDGGEGKGKGDSSEDLLHLQNEDPSDLDQGT